MRNLSRIEARARERAIVAGFCAGTALTSFAWWLILSLPGVAS